MIIYAWRYIKKQILASKQILLKYCEPDPKLLTSRSRTNIDCHRNTALYKIYNHEKSVSTINRPVPLPFTFSKISKEMLRTGLFHLSESRYVCFGFI
jgi:hypothetical protein